MKKLKNWLIDYFNISQTEANGFLVLSFLLLLTIFLPIFVRWSYADRTLVSTDDQLLLDSLVAQLAITQDSFPRKDTLFNFNPNEIGEKEWQKLGLPRFLIQRILKYKEKGGRFNVKSDLLRIYDFPSDLYEKLEPYIQLPASIEKRISTTPTDSIKISKKVAKSEEKMDINKADTLQWKKIKGIGSVLAKRIVAYREKLGGFYSLEQLSEVYGLSEQVVDEIKKVGYIDTNENIRKININQATAEQLAQHPYINFSQAKAIVNYRQQHGNFSSTEELRKIKALEEKTWEKILPYVTFE